MLLCVVLLAVVGAATAFNPCAIDPSACVPLEDFEVNCTCILTYGKPINATDDLFLFLLGHQIPLRLFRQLEMPSMFRKKLKQRIPPPHDFQQSLLSIPENIVRSLRVEENMALFLFNSSFTEHFLRRLANQSLLRTEVGSKWSQWCDEGECNAIVHSTVAHNLTAGTYAHAADILQVIEIRGMSLLAVSSIYAVFDLPKVRSRICDNRCTRFQPNDGLMCRRLCTQKMKFDAVAVTGQLKRDFEMFARASAVSNLREKYSKYMK